MITRITLVLFVSFFVSEVMGMEADTDVDQQEEIQTTEPTTQGIYGVTQVSKAGPQNAPQYPETASNPDRRGSCLSECATSMCSGCCDCLAFSVALATCGCITPWVGT